MYYKFSNGNITDSLSFPPTVNSKKSGVQFVKNMIVVVFLLMIFDGSLRKWVLPSLSTPLLLIKDFIVLIIYVYAIRHKLWPINLAARMGYILSLIFLVIIPIQIMSRDIPFFTVFYGWRNYFFLLPLIFLMQHCLKWNDVKSIARLICLITIPSALLVFIQYLSPPGAFINRSVGGEEEQIIFTVVNNVVRPYGFFSFTNGQAHFSILALSLILLNFFLPLEEKFLEKKMSLIVLMAVLINIVVSGSRSNFMLAGIVLVSLFISGLYLIKTPAGFNTIVYCIVGSLLCSIFLMLFFSENLEQMQERQRIASNTEGSIINRILINYTVVFTSLPSKIPIFGYGLGMGTAYAWRTFGNTEDVYLESEWMKVVFESGIILGFFYLLYRIGLVLYILNVSLKFLRYYHSPTLLILLMSIFLISIAGQMSFNNTTCYFGWLTIGLCLTLVKEFKNDQKTQE